MPTADIAAYVAATLFVLLAAFQLMLALGLPFGRIAWGGESRVLPVNLRWGSFIAIFVLLAAAWIVLARVGIVEFGAGSSVVRIGTWVFAAYFMLNTAANVTSKSKPERFIMTPLTIVIVVCLLTVAVS